MFSESPLDVYHDDLGISFKILVVLIIERFLMILEFLKKGLDVLGILRKFLDVLEIFRSLDVLEVIYSNTPPQSWLSKAGLLLGNRISSMSLRKISGDRHFVNMSAALKLLGM